MGRADRVKGSDCVGDIPLVALPELPTDWEWGADAVLHSDGEGMALALGEEFTLKVGVTADEALTL